MQLPDIKEIIEIAVTAGNKIMEVYNDSSYIQNIEKKEDNSPLTIADKKSHEVIYNSLIKLYPQIPVISEEGTGIDYEKRKSWTTFWLVDPLDGTKEFIKRNGQFTVNIALIHALKPVLGVIQIPVTGEIYFADDKGCFKSDKNGVKKVISVNHKTKDLIAVASSSHKGNESGFLSRFDIKEEINVGSSIKFCFVAEGKADIYYREGPTMEWDTAAGQAIVESAGGVVFNLNYNKPDLKNRSFCCFGFKPDENINL